MELYLQEELEKKYPNLKPRFNPKDIIGSELDIYIADLKLAFELNGVFHYEPIYGVEKLGSIQANDQRKMIACYEQGIELCVIDISSVEQFTKKEGKRFLDIIIQIIEQAISRQSSDVTV